MKIALPLAFEQKHATIPLFLPFAGCPHRCLFCAQDRQTGQSAALHNLAQTLDQLYFQIVQRKEDNRQTELGFFGGTFTLLPMEDQLACLEMGSRCKAQGKIQRIRCSTRPDAVDLKKLQLLAQAGLDLIELGIQSFSEDALLASRRGYSSKTALSGCQIVLDSGLTLGIQFLPGMPGSTPESFLRDVKIALSLHPACLRFYPCLVIDGTPLADMWRSGNYSPWDEATTIRTLGQALSLAWTKHIPVIRLSLAPEKELDAAILAGPRHPALGNCIQTEALFFILKRAIAQGHPSCLFLPKRCQGFFFGYKGQFHSQWKELGIKKVIWTEKEAALVLD